MEELYLRKWEASDLPQVQSYRDAFFRTGEIETIEGAFGLAQCEQIIDFFNLLKSHENKDSLPLGFVPASTYFAIRKKDHKLVGILNIRHYLNDYLLAFGGHIGYSVHPDERRKGYAKEILRQGLIICKKFHIEKALLICKDSNIASRKTILANHGILENEVVEQGVGKLQRYWIHTGNK